MLIEKEGLTAVSTQKRVDGVVTRGYKID